MATERTRRPRTLADALWPTARRAILGLMLADASREWHLRETARRSSLSPATVHDEAGSLVEAGQSDVDLMIMGQVTLRALSGRLRAAQDALPAQ